MERVAVESRVMVPLVYLAEFAAQEQELLPGMPVHPCQEHPEIGKLLPFVAWHLRQQRTLAIHDFVVAEDKNKIFLKSVEQRECDVAVMQAAINRIETHLLEEVVHPTHDPFETEPQTAHIDRTTHAR